MTRSIEAEVTPQLLKWARERSGFSASATAAKMHIEESKLVDWECGRVKPTLAQVRKLAGLYKRPIAIFFLAEPPTTFDAMRDFRRVPGHTAVEQSPALLIEIRRANWKREIAVELAQQIEETPVRLDLSVATEDDPAKVASEIRQFLQIDYATQKRWRNKDKALAAWRNALEEKGILVFHTSQYSDIEVKEMRGFSISAQLFPVIVLNARDSAAGRTFTLLHELVHLLLGDAGLCDLEHSRNARTPEEKIEIFCNRIAGEVLVPQADLFNHSLILHVGKSHRWSDEEIKEIAVDFSVSNEVILRRLLIHHYISEEFYRNKHREYLQRYLEYSGIERRGFAPPFRLVMRNNGLGFLRLVLDAYYRDKISSSNLSDYLGTKLAHLNDIEQAISRS